MGPGLANPTFARAGTPHWRVLGTTIQRRNRTRGILGNFGDLVWPAGAH